MQKFNVPYDQLVKIIDGVTMTWIPALLKQIVRVGYAKKVFKPGGASTIVRAVELELDKTWLPDGET